MKNSIKTITLCLICTLFGVVAQGQELNLTGTGTAFFISGEGLLVTNHHVIEDAEVVGVYLRHQNLYTMYNAKVVMYDDMNDLAILQIDDSRFQPITVPIPYTIKSSTSDVGEDCFTIGYPKIWTMGIEPKLTNGIISSRTGFGVIDGSPSRYQISAPTQRGNSGGPLFDRSGCIIGVVDSGFSGEEYQNVNYAVKSSYLISLIESLPHKPTLPATNMLLGKDLPSQYDQIRDFVCVVATYDVGGSSGASGEPSGAIEDVGFEHNVTQDGQLGMEIHVRFSVRGMVDQQGQASACFYFDSGEKMMTNKNDDQYRTSEGQFAVAAPFIPPTDNALNKDFTLFVPYEAFPYVGSGTYKLKFMVGLFYQDQQLAVSEFVEFTLRWP